MAYSDLVCFLDYPEGIEVILGSLMALPLLLEHSRWHIVTLHVSWMTQGGIEVLFGSLIGLPIWLEDSRWYIVTVHFSWMTHDGFGYSLGP